MTDALDGIFDFWFGVMGQPPDANKNPNTIKHKIICVIEKFVKLCIKKIIIDIVTFSGGSLWQICYKFISILLNVISDEIIMILYSLILKGETCSSIATCFGSKYCCFGSYLQYEWKTKK